MCDIKYQKQIITNTKLRNASIIRQILTILICSLFLLIFLSSAQAAISTVANLVDTGWSNNRKRIVFYNGSRYFLLYSPANSNIYYQSSTDNVTWSVETLLISNTSGVFDIYLVSDTKFDLVYRESTSSVRYVRTCTISGAAINLGAPSVGITENLDSIAVARSGAGEGRIYLIGRNGTNLWVCSANQSGDAANVTAWPKELPDDKLYPTAVVIVPYQDTDKVLVVYTRDPGGSSSDGVYSRVITAGGGAGTEVEVGPSGGFNSVPDISSPVRISDTNFRIIIIPPGDTVQEWKWDGVSSWGVSPVATVDTETDHENPSLLYDRISEDMYVFSVDTGTNDVERHRKLGGGSWETEVVADDGESTARSYPITQMHEPPYGSSRNFPRDIVWCRQFNRIRSKSWDAVTHLSLPQCGERGSW